ncbi:uncharacterized [Tachysurus ichikawai]
MEVNKTGLATSLNFIVMCCSIYHVNSIRSIEHTFPYIQGAGYRSAAGFVPSSLSRVPASFLYITLDKSICQLTQCRYQSQDPQKSNEVKSVFSWERGRPILPQPGHGAGIPLFQFLFSPCTPCSDPNVSGLACGKARTRTGA